LASRTAMWIAARAAAASPWNIGFATEALILAGVRIPSPVLSHWGKYWVTTCANGGSGADLPDGPAPSPRCWATAWPNGAQNAAATSATKKVLAEHIKRNPTKPHSANKVNRKWGTCRVVVVFKRRIFIAQSFFLLFAPRHKFRLGAGQKSWTGAPSCTRLSPRNPSESPLQAGAPTFLSCTLSVAHVAVPLATVESCAMMTAWRFGA